MATEFNYKRAWEEFAAPKFIALPQNIRELYERVQKQCGDMSQNKSLGMNWPDKDDDTDTYDYPLRLVFEKIPSEELARAGHVIYSLGHWDYNKDVKYEELGAQRSLPRDRKGGYWKFEHYAKQSLSDRGYTEYDRHKPDTSQFMDHVEGTELNNDELSKKYTDLLSNSGASVRSVDHCNYKPHPFMITSKHLANSKSMYLDPDAAPCGMKGCNLSYKEHTSDRVLFLSIPNDKMTDSIRNDLKALTTVLEEDGIDGIGLVSSNG